MLNLEGFAFAASFFDGVSTCSVLPWAQGVGEQLLGVFIWLFSSPWELLRMSRAVSAVQGVINDPVEGLG